MTGESVRALSPTAAGVRLSVRGDLSRVDPPRAVNPVPDASGASAVQEARSHESKAQARAADLARVAEKVNRAASALDVQARFSVQKNTGQIMVKIVNTRTGKVLREIPPEKLVDLAHSMERMLGLVVDEKA